MNSDRPWKWGAHPLSRSDAYSGLVLAQVLVLVVAPIAPVSSVWLVRALEAVPGVLLVLVPP